MLILSTRILLRCVLKLCVCTLKSQDPVIESLDSTPIEDVAIQCATSAAPPAPNTPSVVVFVSSASESQVTIAISNSIAVGSFQLTFGTQTLPSGSFQGFNLTQAQIVPSALADPEETSFILDSSATGVIFAFSSVLGQGISSGEDQLILTIQLTEDGISQEGAFCVEVWQHQ